MNIWHDSSRIFTMELSQAQLNNLQTLTVSSSKIKADNLVVGQQLQAKVSTVDPQSGEINLKLNNTVINAKVDAAKILMQLSAGQNLQLTVAQTNANKIVLQLPSTLLDAAIQQKMLREALPKQQPITDTLIQLKALTQTTSSAQVPTNLILFAKKFISKLPTPEQLSTANGVKQAIKKSGIFLENTLSQAISRATKASVDGDIKALLLGLKSTLLKEKETLPNQATNRSNNQTITQPATQPVVRPTTQKNTLLASALASQLKTESNPGKQNQINSSAQKLSTEALSSTLANKNILSPSKPTASNQTMASTAGLTTDSVTNLEKLKYSKIMDIRSNESIISNAIKNTSNPVNTDKLLSDKQIQQVLNNLLGQKKSIQNTFRPTQATGLNPPPVNAQIAPSPNPVGLKSIQGYTGEQNLGTTNEIAMAAIKSQHVSEATAPRINNLVDLIETLIKQVDSAISRTQVHQLNALQDQDQNKLALSLEIPINDDDDLHLVQLEIEKEQNKENETETVVTVNLAIDLNAIGPVYAKITLVNDKTSVVLWAERDATFKLVQESVDVLQLTLKSAGLTPDGIACHHGQPPQSRFVKADINNGLVDERA